MKSSTVSNRVGGLSAFALRFYVSTERKLGRLLLVAGCVLVGCAPHLGPTIETPEVPVASIQGDLRTRMGSYVSLQGVEDVRPSPNANAEYTQPTGAVREIVEAAIRNSFREQGIAVLDTAPVQLKAELRDWRSKVKSGTMTAVESKAVLYVELFDPSGKRIYSGTYEGTRASQFPVVNRIDVKDSLGLAMSNCISHILSDPKVLEIIGSY